MELPFCPDLISVDREPSAREDVASMPLASNAHVAHLRHARAELTAGCCVEAGSHLAGILDKDSLCSKLGIRGPARILVGLPSTCRHVGTDSPGNHGSRIMNEELILVRWYVNRWPAAVNCTPDQSVKIASIAIKGFADVATACCVKSMELCRGEDNFLHG